MIGLLGPFFLCKLVEVHVRIDDKELYLIYVTCVGLILIYVPLHATIDLFTCTQVNLLFYMFNHIYYLKLIEMLLNRITVLSRLAKKDKGPKRRESEELILNLEAGDLHKIEDKDIWENNKYKLKFQQIRPFKIYQQMKYKKLICCTARSTIQ